MPEQLHKQSGFVQQARAVIHENLTNEQFGVSSLANAMRMSRSNLLRKIKKHTGLSASQFIRQIRLEESMKLLQQALLTVSEVAFQVGFGSASYFIKCFREQYGYPPGAIGKGAFNEPTDTSHAQPARRYKLAFIVFLALGVLALGYLIWPQKETIPPEAVSKSLAVLPFKNESADASNQYFVNGLMQSTLNNLQRIKDLRVVSRTSVEQYRQSKKDVPTIAKELNVNYLVEGSGQRIGDQVLLNIQLIEASSDTPIWVEQYQQQVNDVFKIQEEVANKIAAAIEAIVTPAELEQIKKIPTENLVAYEYYLKAMEPFHSRTTEGLENAISLFIQATEEDREFALAYANLAISYYFLDEFQKEKQFTDLINSYADKALLYDSKSDISLIAKAMYYMHTEEYRLALPHLEKALEYNPNSSAAVQMISILYAFYIPDTEEFLKYALKGSQLDIAANDSVSRSYVYLNLSNALLQTGFIEEASDYVNKSLDFDTTNYYAPYLRSIIAFSREGEQENARQQLLEAYKNDSTRLDILQELGKFCYLEEDFESAYAFYRKFVDSRNEQGLTLYPNEDIRIAYVFKKMGLKEEAASLYKSYAEFCERDASIYQSLHKAYRDAYVGEVKGVIDHLSTFSQQENYQFLMIIFLEKDPLFRELKDNPEYKNAIQEIKDQFWMKHKELNNYLKENSLI